MKVSIITSCFNREATIGDAIESVLSQTYPDIEYIVIDGASKDNSWAVIQRYKEGIAHIVRKFEETGADLVYGNGLFVDAKDTQKVVRNWISGSYSKGKMKRGWLPLHPTVYIRRECIERLGMYDESFKIAADSDFLVRYLYEGNLKVAYLDEYIVRMRMGGLSTDPEKMKQKWAEDLRMYRSHGFSPYLTLGMKILSKIPQFISAKLMKKGAI